MSNQECTQNLEKKLSKQLWKRRIIEGVIFFLLLIMGVVFSLLREASKEVINHDYVIFPYTEVVYNNNYIAGIIIGYMGAFFTFIIALSDLLSSRYETTQANGHYITIYRAMFSCSVYINGEEKGKLTAFSFEHVIETTLPDGVKVIVSFGRSILTIAHVSFSDHNESVDL